MTQILSLFILFLWIIDALFDYTELCYLWQLKEYRFDRFRDFLSTPEGQWYFLQFRYIGRPLIALVVFFLPINNATFVDWILVALLTLENLHGFMALIRRRSRRPDFTLRAVSIIALTLVVESTWLFFSKDWTIVFLLLVIRSVLFAFVVGLTSIPVRVVKSWRMEAARKKLAQFPKVLVIGVTGSYAKTTTKTFLAHILQDKFRVLATPTHVNTDIGVAEFVLANDFADCDVFVVEMGAYRVGEIKMICDIVHPNIGILTGINEQHLSLFGSMKNIQQAKFELLRSLPKSGFAVTNSDNPYCRELLPEIAPPYETFGREVVTHPNLQVVETIQKKDNLHVTYAYRNGAPWTVTIPVFGLHQAMNIAPCILVAKHLGMTEAEIGQQLSTIRPLDKKLAVYSYGASTVIDDSYNANPDGFSAALTMLSAFGAEMKRVVITRGMIELGQRSAPIHERIGGEMRGAVDELILISRDPETAFRKGLGGNASNMLTAVTDPDELLAIVKAFHETPHVVLIENRLPELVYRELSKEKTV